SKRKQLFGTSDEPTLLFYIRVSRKIFWNRPAGVIVHVGYGLVMMLKIFSPRLKIIYYHHGTSLHTKLNPSQWEKLNKNIVGLISVNEIAIKKVINTFNSGESHVKYFTLYNAILPLINSNEIENESKLARISLNIEKDDFVITYSGRICKEKGVLNLIKAFEIVSKIHSKAKLNIIGGPGTAKYLENGLKYMELCKRYCKDKNINVNFTGYLTPDVLKVYLLASDVIVLPTDPSLSEEGLSLSLIEGLSLGKPLIATDSGGNKEIVYDGVNGFIIPYDLNYHKQLAIKLDDLICNKDLHTSFSKKSLELFNNKFSYFIYQNNFKKILTEINFL
ncbi:MAG: glycosyltransferase family 4 protein, partial [Flavobacteriaceae bacterium]|nr:glycosyltransferase family 4 protein [Flavobacteriaceae bacterium]